MATREIPYNQWYRWIERALEEDCPGLYNKIDVYSDGLTYAETKIGLYVRFKGI